MNLELGMHDGGAVELHPSMRLGLKRKQAPMWLNTQDTGAGKHSQHVEPPSKMQKMPGELNTLLLTPFHLMFLWYLAGSTLPKGGVNCPFHVRLPQ